MCIPRGEEKTIHLSATPYSKEEERVSEKPLKSQKKVPLKKFKKVPHLKIF